MANALEPKVPQAEESAHAFGDELSKACGFGNALAPPQGSFEPTESARAPVANELVPEVPQAKPEVPEAKASAPVEQADVIAVPSTGVATKTAASAVATQSAAANAAVGEIVAGAIPTETLRRIEENRAKALARRAAKVARSAAKGKEGDWSELPDSPIEDLFPACRVAGAPIDKPPAEPVGGPPAEPPGAEATCVVCSEALLSVAGEPHVAPCGHVFHRPCIVNWADMWKVPLADACPLHTKVEAPGTIIDDADMPAAGSDSDQGVPSQTVDEEHLSDAVKKALLASG